MSSTEPNIRMPAVAGLFYPGDPEECRRAASELFALAGPSIEGPWIGALVPHAGWIYSGKIAAGAIANLKKAQPSPEVIVVFGAVHTVGGIAYGALDDHDAWQLPTGLSPIALGLQRHLLDAVPALRLDSRVHRREHAIEVIVPLLQHAWGDTPVLPIEVPPVESAAKLGHAVAAELKKMGTRALFIASSDLTHYGSNYGIMHAGEGQGALNWASENDRSLLEKIENLQEQEIVAETRGNRSACGGGAIAAMLGACTEMGAKESRIIRHSNSHEVLPQGIAESFVGYASAVVG